jgi:hypothetical protein
MTGKKPRSLLSMPGRTETMAGWVPIRNQKRSRFISKLFYADNYSVADIHRRIFHLQIIRTHSGVSTVGEASNSSFSKAA